MSAKKSAAVAAFILACAGGIYFATGHERGHQSLQRTNATLAKTSPVGQDLQESQPYADAGGQTAAPTKQLAVSAQTYQTAPSLAASKLEATGEMTSSAAILQSLEKGRIPNPKDFASIEGVVVDTHGQPVPQASITALASPGGAAPGSLVSLLAVRQNPAHTSSATSDSAGHFVIEGIAYEGVATITAMADGYSMKNRRGVPVPVKSGDKIGGIRITLEPGAGLYGRLLSAEGTPVSDAVVNLVAYRTRAESPNGMLGSANTDARGNFRFALSREGTAFLVVSSLKYGGASFDDVPVGSEEVVELKMPAPARLAGTIRWKNGGAAPNMLVLITGNANDGHGQRRVPASIYAAKTDESGNYAIESIDVNQTYTATVALPDQTPVSQPEHLREFSPGATQTWDYTIQELITVRGHVVGERTGRPLRDIKVAALKDGQPVENSETPVMADGSYEMKLTSGPGNYTIYPRLWRIEPQVTGYKFGKAVVLTPEQDAVVDLTFMDTATMSIRVVDAAGQPLRGLMLGIHEGDHTWLPVATTPADGRFTWAGFMPGVESNFVVHENMEEIGATDPITAEPGQVFDEQTVVVYGSAGIEGTAIKPNGEPLANGVIELTISYALSRQMSRRVNTDSSGHFVASDGLPATGVIIEMSAYIENDGKVDRYQFVSDEMVLIDKQIQNMGTLRFQLSESNVNVEP